MLMPRQPVPDPAQLKLAHRPYDLMPDGAKRISLLVAYRGLRCTNGVDLYAHGKHTDLLNENEFTTTTLKQKIWLSNPGTNPPKKVIEAQLQTYLWEDDVVRFEDQYGWQSV